MIKSSWTHTFSTSTCGPRVFHIKQFFPENIHNNKHIFLKMRDEWHESENTTEHV